MRDGEAGVAVFTSRWEAELQGVASMLEREGIRTSVALPPSVGYMRLPVGTVYVLVRDEGRARELISTEWAAPDDDPSQTIAADRYGSDDEYDDDDRATYESLRRRRRQRAIAWVALVSMTGGGLLAILRWVWSLVW